MASKSLQEFARGVVTSSGALTGSDDDGQKTKIDPISAISLFATWIPLLIDGLKKCRSLKNDQVQGYVASRHRPTSHPFSRSPLMSSIHENLNIPSDSKMSFLFLLSFYIFYILLLLLFI